MKIICSSGVCRQFVMSLMLSLACSTSFAAKPVISEENLRKCNEILADFDRQLSQIQSPSQIDAFQRPVPIFPWVTVSTTHIGPREEVSDSQIAEMKDALARTRMLLLALQNEQQGLPPSVRDDFSEALARYTSLYLSQQGIHHDFISFRNLLGHKRYQIRIKADGAGGPLAVLASDIEADGGHLILDFHFLTSGLGMASFQEGTIRKSPFLSNKVQMLLMRLLNPVFSRYPEIGMPLRSAENPNAVYATIGLRHEIRHFKNSSRVFKREKFPFYGTLIMAMRSSFTEFVQIDPGWNAYLNQSYKWFIGVDENDTYVQNLFDMADVFDDPLAAFNDDATDGFDLIEQFIRMAGGLESAFATITKSVGEAILSQLDGKTALDGKKAPVIKYKTKNDVVWASVSLMLTNSVRSLVTWHLPLVHAGPKDSPDQYAQHVRDQVKLALDNLPDRAILAQWVSRYDELKKTYADIPPRDFARIFLHSLIHPQFTFDPDYRSVTEDALRLSLKTGVEKWSIAK